VAGLKHYKPASSNPTNYSHWFRTASNPEAVALRGHWRPFDHHHV
jgi:hypothetical protein